MKTIDMLSIVMKKNQSELEEVLNKLYRATPITAQAVRHIESCVIAIEATRFQILLKIDEIIAEFAKDETVGYITNISVKEVDNKIIQLKVGVGKSIKNQKSNMDPEDPEALKALFKSHLQNKLGGTAFVLAPDDGDDTQFRELEILTNAVQVITRIEEHAAVHGNSVLGKYAKLLAKKYIEPLS